MKCIPLQRLCAYTQFQVVKHPEKKAASRSNGSKAIMARFEELSYTQLVLKLESKKQVGGPSGAVGAKMNTDYLTDACWSKGPIYSILSGTSGL